VHEEGTLAAELHVLIDRRALARRGALFAFTAGLEEAEAGALVLVGQSSTSGRLLVRRDADGVARVAREDGCGVNAVAFDWSESKAGRAYRLVPPAEGLERLLADTAAAPVVVDASAAQALAELATRVTWRVPSS
jgi:hypothetical protein